MKKILFITPHLSTGGLPQYLLKKVQCLVNEFDVYIVEWDNIADAYVIQKNKLRELIREKLITLSSNKEEIFSIIEKINPEIVHFEEYPETFITDDILKRLYGNSSYKICETTHGTMFNLNDKWVMADKTMFVSGCNMEQYIKTTNDFDVLEFPHSTADLKRRYLDELGLDPSYFHVINVGLFTPGKNQKEIFEYAKKLKDKKIIFHFIGNRALNFEAYWKPLLDDMPNNCVLWNERDDVYKFLIAGDLFLFTSKFENRPITLVEANSYNIPILAYNLSTYGDGLSKFKNIQFLTDDFDKNIKLIKSYLLYETSSYDVKIDLSSADYKITARHLLTDVFAKREMKSIQTLSKLKNYGIDYKMCFNKPYKELPPRENCINPDLISMEPGGKLTPGHYGCYLAHKNGLLEAIAEDKYDFIMMFECDCGIRITTDQFVNYINKACKILNNNKDLIMFSFVHHHNENILEKKNDYMIVSHFVAAHAYLIPRRSYELFKNMYATAPWNVTDLLFMNNLNKYKTGVFDEILTMQFSGYSLLDKIDYSGERV
jgi:GR25 family glycosyltransferase involved in LPS biosynthesis